MKPNIDTEQIKGIIIPALSFVVIVALIPLVIIPQLNKIADASKIIEQDKNRLDKIIKKANDLKSLSDKKDTLDTELATVESSLPLDKSIAPLVLGTYKLAQNSQLVVSKLQVQPGKIATSSAKAKTVSSPNPQSGVGVYSTQNSMIFSMTMTGDLISFQHFLEALENAKRLLLIQQFNVKSNNKPNSYDVEVFISAPFGPLPVLSSDQVAQELATLSDDNNKLLQQLQANVSTDNTASQIPLTPSGVTNPFP